MVTLLIAIIVLQFAGANFGAHQLHMGNGAEESDNHPHLQFSASVTTLTQCLDCVCPSEQSLGFALDVDIAGKTAAKNLGSELHSHLVKTTEIQDFDLCLDCQCHGGHVALLSSVLNQPEQALESVYLANDLTYFSPDNLPKYRPPIV